MVIKKHNPKSIEITSEFLREGKVVVLPTDTIYGISGIVPGSNSLIISAKGRDEGKPFIQLIARPEDLSRYTPDGINPELLRLWPGAVTIIVNNRSGGTTAYRCPGDGWLRAVIEKADAPIYSTSVNKAGAPALKGIDEIREQFEGVVDLIVDDGDHPDALASTIVDASASVYRVVRQGSVNIPQICLHA